MGLLNKYLSISNLLGGQSLNNLRQKKGYSNNVRINSSQDFSLDAKDVVIGQILTFSDEKGKFEDKLKNLNILFQKIK